MHNDKPLDRLLAVDEKSDIILVLKLSLLKYEFLGDVFTNPEEVLKSFKSNAKAYCLVLSDVRMLALSRIQLARKVKEINSDVKVSHPTHRGLGYHSKQVRFHIRQPTRQLLREYFLENSIS